MVNGGNTCTMPPVRRERSVHYMGDRRVLLSPMSLHKVMEERDRETGSMVKREETESGESSLRNVSVFRLGRLSLRMPIRPQRHETMEERRVRRRVGRKMGSRICGVLSYLSGFALAYDPRLRSGSTARHSPQALKNDPALGEVSVPCRRSSDDS